MQSSGLGSTVPELGRYRLIAELARGGMGIVHLAASQGAGRFNKLLVVKELKPELAGEAGYVTMFLDEARLAARLAHPNIVQTIEVGSEGSRHFMVMEFLDGRSLHRTIRRFRDQGGFPIGAHLRLIAEALLGLQYAHDLQDFGGQPLGIVHRDVSPLNLFVTFDGQAKVLDFGIAKSIDSSQETKTGVLKGRVAYMAPEQALCLRVDRRADLYSAGVMLWEAAAGRRVWPRMNDVEILSKLLREGPPMLRTVRPDAPEDLEAICTRAMERRPEDRYASASAMLEDLETHLATRGDGIRLRAIGPLVARAFAGERRRLSALIEETLTRIGSDPRSGVMPRWEVRVRGTPGGGRADGEGNRPVSGRPDETPLFEAPTLSAPSVGVPSVSVPTVRVPSVRVPPISTPPLATTPWRAGVVPWWASRRAALSAAGGAVLLLMVLGGAVVNGDRKSEEVAAAHAVAAPGSAPAPHPLPDRVDVVVRVSPASAQIAVDGAPVATNPWHARYAKDAQAHHLLASADGYESRRVEVFFADDVTIDIHLDRQASEPAPDDTPLPQPPH
jgi:hypothetical protein